MTGVNFKSSIVLISAIVVGCGRTATNDASSAGADKAIPSFTLAWSEYPSWSVFGVAHAKKLIHKDQGKLGPVEEKWGVDIVLSQLGYDACIQQYGNGDVDAVCITNMDILSPSLSRSSVAILPTSTSNGADACIVVGVDNVQQLREHKVYGLGKSVSEYCFVRNLELQNENESDHQFADREPDAAAQQMQTDPANTTAIMVWNPFVLQTLRTVDGSKRLFDSSSIKGEIVDMVVAAKSSLDKPGGDKFASAVIDTFYQVSDMIENSATRDDTLQALAVKFAPDLTIDDMNQIVAETEFYKTPDAGMALFSGAEFPQTMKTVLSFCTGHGMVDKEPTIVYAAGEADLQFDPRYIQRVKNGP